MLLSSRTSSEGITSGGVPMGCASSLLSSSPLVKSASAGVATSGLAGGDGDESDRSMQIVKL